MRISTKPAFCFLITFILCLPLHADVIVTKDNMILNGKIVEDKKPDHVKFTNKYGTFTIEYTQIKEIHKTESDEDDKKILKELAKTLKKEDIKKGVKSDEKKSGKQGGDASKPGAGKENFILMLEFFRLENYGKLDDALPDSKGTALSGEVPVEQYRFFQNFFIHSIKSEIGCFLSEQDERSIKGYHASTGPLWRLPVTVFNYDFSIKLCAAIGAGRYSVKNNNEKAESVKWNLSAHAGPEFSFYPVLVSAQLRFDYIYDSAAPLYAGGISIGAGYKF